MYTVVLISSRVKRMPESSCEPFGFFPRSIGVFFFKKLVRPWVESQNGCAGKDQKHKESLNLSFYYVI